MPAAMSLAPPILGSGSMAPPWAVFPMAMVTMVVIAAHIRALGRADMPASRRRIRTANGWLMMFLTIALACAFGVASSVNPRLFVLNWMAVAGLTGIVLVLAWIDAVNSLRLHRRDRQQLHDHMREIVTGGVAGPGDQLRLADQPSSADRDSSR